MEKYETIKIETKDHVGTVTLNRPDIHNAFNPLMIEELTSVFKFLNNDDDIRMIVLTGAGKSFSAGADLNYMKKSKDFTYEENKDDAFKLEQMFFTIYKTSKPVLAKVNGAAFGGGVGLISVCDIALSLKKAKMAFSEVNLGIMPAVISPYVIAKIGFSNASRFFLTGERFDGQKAYEIGLIHEAFETLDELEQKQEEIIKNLLASSPKAMASIKKLLNRNRGKEFQEIREYCIEEIARIRTSDEGKEGLSAFLEKRAPRWKLP
ncbi:MAG: enoyl-CoA hydratase/isomerase family protein [Candidatus Hodarchaeales archaeon]